MGFAVEPFFRDLDFDNDGKVDIEEWFRHFLVVRETGHTDDEIFVMISHMNNPDECAFWSSETPEETAAQDDRWLFCLVTC